jgi:hypothetical protein
MKEMNYNVFLFLLITTLLISCKENKEKNLQNEIEEKIKTGLNDPSSYEFNHFYIDSIGYTSKKELIAENLEKINKLQKQTEDKKAEDKIIDLEVENQRFEMMNKYKFTGTFSFRGNNKFGAKILAEYRFEANSSYTLMYLMDNTGDTIYKDAEILMKETDKLINESEELRKDNK